MSNLPTLSIGVALGKLVRELELSMLSKEAASGELVVPVLNSLVDYLLSDPGHCKEAGIRDPQETADTMKNWLHRLVDDDDLPRAVEPGTSMHLYSDMQIYFGNLIDSPFDQ